MATLEDVRMPSLRDKQLAQAEAVKMAEEPKKKRKVEKKLSRRKK